MTFVFALLFFAQTAVFVFLYRRAVMRRDVSRDAVNHITPETGEESKIGEKQEAALPTSALAALALIRERGSVISSDVSRGLNLSREHTARLMKSLYERGLVDRSGKPFRYSLTEKGQAILNQKNQ
ncbi:MAG: winged helix DNA-binding protein [Candidatus Caldarchaeum sp.]|nr:winged helix DNA-binding protein [Candidatus Caldarchaeum sp.]MDW8358997.1 winged helix DNA-binding protein [Candidatus Caldarchaeum sp.]